MYILLFATFFAAVLAASFPVLYSSTSTISFSLPPGLGAESYTLEKLTDETEISVIYSEMQFGNYGQYRLSSLIKRLASLVKKGDVPKRDACAFGRTSGLVLRKNVYKMVSRASALLVSTGEYACQVLELMRNGAPLSEFVRAEMGREKSDFQSRLSIAAHRIFGLTVIEVGRVISVDVSGALSERLGGVSSYTFSKFDERLTLNEVLQEFQLGLFGQQSLRIFMNTLVKLVDSLLITNVEHDMWFSDKRIRLQERRNIVTAVKTIKRLSKTSNHYQEIFSLGQGDKSLLEFAQGADIRSDQFWNQQIETFNLAAAQKEIASRVELNDRGQVVLNLQPCLATALETRQFSFINVTRNTNLEALWNEMFEKPDVRKRADRFTAKAFELINTRVIDFYTFFAMNAHPLLRLDIRLKLAMVKNALKDIAHGSEFLILQWMMGDATPLEFFNNHGNLPLSRISDSPEKWNEIVAAYYQEQTAKPGLNELGPSLNWDQQVQPNRKRPAVNSDQRNPKRPVLRSMAQQVSDLPAVNTEFSFPDQAVLNTAQQATDLPAVNTEFSFPVEEFSLSFLDEEIDSFLAANWPFEEGEEEEEEEKVTHKEPPSKF